MAIRGADLPTVTVIIPTYGRVQKLAASVRAILADPATTECIVSVDGSRDGSYALARRLSDEDDRLIPLYNEHSGKHGAMVTAIALAKGEVVLLIDDDVVAGPGLVTGHARRHVSQERLVVMGYTPCVPSNAKSSVVFITSLYGREYENSCREIEADPGLVLRQLWGGNISMRREDWIRVGLRIPNFSHEDSDLGLRCLRAGYAGIFDRNLRAEHHHERSARDFLSGSRSFGIGRWLLHHDHADIVGPYRSKWDSDSRWAPSRALYVIGRAPRLAHGLAVVSLFVGWTATKWGIGSIESVAYKMARQLELEVGATIASRLDESEIADRSVSASPANADQIL